MDALDGAAELDVNSDYVPAHPLGVKPSGNALTATFDIRPAMGVLASLPDEMIMMFLETLDAPDLRALSGTCRALYAFGRSEELWRALFTAKKIKKFVWRGSWYATYTNLPQSVIASPDCSSLYSDTLYRPLQCANVNLTPYVTKIPKRNRIARFSDLSHEDFTEKWSDKPFILAEPVKSWPVYKTWSTRDVLKNQGQKIFRAEAVDWRLRDYYEYMEDNLDESPLYLFDTKFVSTMGLKGPDSRTVHRANGTNEDVDASETPSFWPPPCFGHDLFSVLGSMRPDHQWIIIGPTRSGSSFHKDPNATSAWNAVLRGAKYWIMFPPKNHGDRNFTPPGVFVSDDQSEVTAPLSIAEWLLTFHAEARRTPGCLEGICGEGEILHVPSGWWHLVVNLEPSVAITQNFVPTRHLPAVLDFLKNKPDQVSGFRKEVCDKAFVEFVDRMREVHPDLLEEGLKRLEEREQKGSKKRKWDEVVHGGEEQAAGGFSFGFSEVDDASDADIR
ncbi:hypothetical protein KEM56_006702 [Ascosphaera pollenicola]|nr:hypothetical protein KEM56_006702 [Ascosphaera pollenicola]